MMFATAAMAQCITAVFGYTSSPDSLRSLLDDPSHCQSDSDEEQIQKPDRKTVKRFPAVWFSFYASPATEATIPDSTLYKSGTDLYIEEGWAAKYGFL